ncbi:ABC transporter ATP-binding protein [bacterium]|nr:ABC transporter ATP-binding protein [bacterium]
MSDEAVLCEKLEKVYPGPGGGVAALRGVDLSVARGEVVAVTGASGSGKTTLLHVLGAIDAPTRGRASVLGEDVGALAGFARTRFRREKVGFVFQQFHLVPTLTALEQVELPLRYAGVARAPRLERAAKLLERVGLTSRALHLPAALSGGEQQRVALARALANEPGLLLADEPTGNLDGERASAVIDLLLAARKERGVAVLIVTHDPVVAARADRIVRMRDGLVLSGEAA